MATILRHRRARSPPLASRGWTSGVRVAKVTALVSWVVPSATPESWGLAEGRRSPLRCADDGQHARSERLQARASPPVLRLQNRTPGHRDDAARYAPTIRDGAIPRGGAGQPWCESRAYGPQRERCESQRGGAAGRTRVPGAREQNRAGDETTRGQEHRQAPHQTIVGPRTSLGSRHFVLSASPTPALVGCRREPMVLVI